MLCMLKHFVKFAEVNSAKTGCARWKCQSNFAFHSLALSLHKKLNGIQ